jgi:hypothetical protein
VGGPVLERAKRWLMLLAIRILRLPLRLLTLPLTQLRHEVMSLRAAAVESLAYVGVELRRLGDLVERGGSPEAAGAPANGTGTSVIEVPFAFRSLGEVDAPGPVLVVGPRGREIARSLSSLGYEVVRVDGRLEDWDPAGRRFPAILHMGRPAQPAGEELARIRDLLVDGGVLVMSVAFGLSGANGSPNGYDGGALDEQLADWKVADRMVVASTPDRGWAPVQNGSTPESGVALVAARRVDA